MSENTEVVRRIFDAVERRDRDTVLSLYASDVEVRFAKGTFADRIRERPVYQGHEGLAAFDRELREGFSRFETTCEELIDAGELVVSASRYEATGRTSGIEITGPVQFGVWALRDGKVVRVDWFPTREQALELAGVSG